MPSPTNLGAISASLDGELYNDVVTGRSPGEWITNKSDYPILILVSADSGAAAANKVLIQCHVNDSKTDNKVIDEQAQAADSANAVNAIASLTFVVMPGHHYKIMIQSDGGGIRDWKQMRFGGPP